MKTICQKFREIKFRAWCPDFKEMFEVSSIDFLNKTAFLFSGGRISHGTTRMKLLAEAMPLDHIVLLQYIGLKDKNGKEIYEGDFVKWPQIRATYIDKPPIEISIVVFEKGAFRRQGAEVKGMIQDPNDTKELIANAHPSWGFPNEKDYEVIGNIYENHELIAN